MASPLLTRDIFREDVFLRDGHKCVHCGKPGKDAHHIMERRLFPDGGYYIDNGVTLCEACHLAAEATTLACSTLRAEAGIGQVVLPPHLFLDQEYDKWGNSILANGMRMRGELFDDESVQKILQPVLHLFTARIKYPRTMHFDWSPGLKNDDRKLANGTLGWEGSEVVITEKMDGEGTTFYTHDLHARSLEFEPHPSRERIKAIHAQIAHDIPETFRFCGENLTAVHSIQYANLTSFFLLFNVWDGLTCLSWNETIEWATLLGLQVVPVIYRGLYSDDVCKALCGGLDLRTQEGLVVRPARSFHMKEYASAVGKFVRRGHVQTDQHWMRRAVEYNLLTTV